MKTEDRDRSGGIAAGEMLFLILLVVVFLVGVVWLVDKGVSGTEAGREPGPAGEAAIVLDRIESVSADARQINWTTAPEDGLRRLDVLVNVDGDSSTGEYSAGGVEGLERVVIHQPSAMDGRLVVEVYTKPGEKPRMKELTSVLNPGDPGAFDFEYVVDLENETVLNEQHEGEENPPAVQVEGLTVTVRVSEKGKASDSTRSFRFHCVPVPLSS